MEKYILIIAGGRGKRIGGDVPKQFIEIAGRPLLMWTFEAFEFLKLEAKFVLVLNSDLIGLWKHLCRQYSFNIPHKVVEGGPKRFHSVKRGLNLIPGNSLVAIHDAVRPLVSKQTIQNCFTIANRKGNAVPAILVNESMRKIDGPLNQHVERNDYRLIQTPQTFISDKIKKAYQQNYHERFTDDATVFESAGESIQLVEGNRQNLKITYKEDLLYASKLLKLP